MSSKVILVTGGNKGIGYAIVRKLAINYASSSPTQPLTILLTARNPTLGQSSTEKLLEELKPKNILVNDGGNIDLKYVRLDLTDEQSINDVKEFIAKDYGGLDVLINNAAMAFKGNAFDINVVRTTFATNFYGTLNVINILYPLIRPNGRIVNVSSTAGKSHILSDALKQEFSKEDLEIDGLIGLLKRFEDAVEKGTYEQDGWPRQAYGVSKVGVTILSRILGRRADKEGKNIKIFACCPGWVKTDMAGDKAPLTPGMYSLSLCIMYIFESFEANILFLKDQGAETPVLLALGESMNSEENGTFWKDGKLNQW
ncbi:6974_t:CDS:2 [Gigaspora margarita]|uniref:6974_t:CDS:1 n=1 Tax=Gigaspora margarita TaxID=4874 RepID=A0ABN7V0P7_GIGMA|nr:6974_t:CDS:2 [Gigaspora margarita]